MFREDYKGLKKKHEKLMRMLSRKETVMNQKILLRDLYVYPHVNYYGEFENYPKNETVADTLTRLVDHVGFLANFASIYHDKSVANKKDRLNTITRILTYEFSLYTHVPLSLDSFSLFIKSIRKMLSNKNENIHLLLATLPVVNSDNKLMDMAVYIQCGAEPRMNVFCKTFPSPVDLKFKNFEMFRFANKDEISHRAYIVSEHGENISNDTLFVVKTAGGAEYLQAVDICSDHTTLHAKALALQLLTLNFCDDTTIIPSQVDHIITSNTTKAREDSIITDNNIQIDPINRREKMARNDLVKPQDLLHLLSDKYKKLEILLSDSGFEVNNAPFGGNFDIIAAKERSLGGFTKSLEQLMKNRNAIVKCNIALKQLAHLDHEEKFQKYFHDTASLIENLDRLFKEMLNLCQFKLSFIRTKKYKLKLSVVELIQKNNMYFNQHRFEPDVISDTVMEKLTALKEELVKLNNNKNEKYIRDLVTTLDKVLSELKPSKLPYRDF